VLVISVRIQISPNQNLPRERHRFFRSGDPFFRSGSAPDQPFRAGRAQNDH